MAEGKAESKTAAKTKASEAAMAATTPQTTAASASAQQDASQETSAAAAAPMATPTAKASTPATRKASARRSKAEGSGSKVATTTPGSLRGKRKARTIANATESSAKRRVQRRNLCLCQQFQDILPPERSGACLLAEERYYEKDPDHPLLGKMLRMPDTDERKVRYGGIVRRQRWCFHLGIDEQAVAERVREPQIRWTHFPPECWETGERKLQRVVPAKPDTLAGDRIMGTGNAIAVPSVKFTDNDLVVSSWRKEEDSSDDEEEDSSTEAVDNKPTAKGKREPASPYSMGINSRLRNLMDQAVEASSTETAEAKATAQAASNSSVAAALAAAAAAAAAISPPPAPAPATLAESHALIKTLHAEKYALQAHIAESAKLLVDMENDHTDKLKRLSRELNISQAQQRRSQTTIRKMRAEAVKADQHGRPAIVATTHDVYQEVRDLAETFTAVQSRLDALVKHTSATEAAITASANKAPTSTT